MNSSVRELKEAIAEMQSTYNDSDTPENVKELIKPSLENAKNKLAELEKGHKAAPAEKKSVASKYKPEKKATPAPKHKDASKKKSGDDYSRALQLAKKYRGEQGLSTKDSDIERDAKRSSKPAGKRVSEDGNVYYENRENRSDRYKSKYPKLERGGEVDTTVATTILQQIGGMGKLKMMTGAYNFIAYPNGVSFKMKNPSANYVKITLNGKDLYDLEVGRIRGNKYTIVKEVNDLYWDDLKPQIESATGLYLSLFEKGGEADSASGYVVFYVKDGNMRERNFSNIEKEQAELFAKSVNSEAIPIKKLEDGGMLGDATNDFRFDISSPMFAEGGMIPHGFHSGDIIYEIYKGYAIIEAPHNHDRLKHPNESDVIVVNPNIGRRYVIEKSAPDFKAAVQKARNMIDENANRNFGYVNEWGSKDSSVEPPVYADGGTLFDKKEMDAILEKSIKQLYIGLNEIDVATRYLEKTGQGGSVSAFKYQIGYKNLVSSIQAIEKMLEVKYASGGALSGKEKFEHDAKALKDQIHMVQLEDGTLVRGKDLKFADGGEVDNNSYKEYIKKIGANPVGDLNYTTQHQGIDYYIAIIGNKAIVIAFMDGDNHMIDKQDAIEMSETARFKGIKTVELHTNYGVELHSKNEKPEDIGFDKIKKISPTYAKGGGIYSSDDVFTLSVYDLNKDNLLEQKNIRAKNYKEAQEIAYDMEDQLKKKHGTDLFLNLKKTYAEGGTLASRTTVEVGEEPITVIIKKKETTGYPVYISTVGYAPITHNLYPTKEKAIATAKSLANHNGYALKFEQGGQVDGWADLSTIAPAKIQNKETTAYGSPDKLILFFNDKKIADFYFNMKGYNANFSLKNKDGVHWGFSGDRSKTYQISEFKKALKDGFVYIKTYDKYGDGGATFSDKVKAISEKLSGSKVVSKYKAKYGDKYSPAEAKEAATKIVGKMVSKSGEMAKKGGRKAKNAISSATKKISDKYKTKK